MKITMNIPTSQLVATRDHDEGLTIYNNKHDVKTDFWKGVVVDDVTGNVVARSFKASPIVTTLEVPEDLVYVPGMECTILRFYRHHGIPMISTHRNINIVGTRSRIGNGRFLFDLVKDAITGWENRVETFEIEGKKGIAYTPDNWEDLCIEGWCNVFLLVDVSNQKTDLVDTTQYSHPLLLFSMSLSSETTEMTPIPSVPVWGTEGTRGSDIVGGTDETLYEYVSWCLPSLPLLNKEQAEEILKSGGTVIGFRPEVKDVTTKYVSPVYARKLDLVNDNTNIIHRWHELMDESEEKAREYLAHLPHALRHMDEKYMRDTHDKYLQDTSVYLANVIVSRFTGYDSPMPEILERKSKPIVEGEVRRLRNKYSRGSRPPTKDKLSKLVEKSVRDELSNHTYSFRHQLHSKMARDQIENSIASKKK